MVTQGLVFNVQRYSIHDGPGIRTTLFLKGCPLHCLWCHNPESMSGRVEFSFSPERCIGCLECTRACPNAVHRVEEGRRVIRRDLCQGKGFCTNVCYPEALQPLGYFLSVEDAVAEVARDRPFYDASGGGVTISGGEPLLQPEFAAALLERCRRLKLHTTLDTCGYAPWPVLEAVAAHADLVLYDVKHADPVTHRRLTGVSNELILDNLARLLALENRGDVVIRIPLITGHNDQPDNLWAIGRLLGLLRESAHLEVLQVDILPYHQLGISKYRRLGRPYPAEDITPPSQEQLQAAATIFQRCGLDTRIGQ